MTAPSQQAYDPYAPPASLDDATLTRGLEAELREALWSLQRIAHSRRALEAQRETVMANALTMARRLGRPVALFNPVTNSREIAIVRADETLEVDLELLKTLVPEEVWKGVLKPEAVDTKDDGLFHQAVARGAIGPKVVARVARFKPKAAWIMFTHPDKKPGEAVRPTWLSLAQIARELGVSGKTVHKHLRRVRWYYPPAGEPPRWDAQVVDLLAALRDKPHRTLDGPDEDWLTHYLHTQMHNEIHNDAPHIDNPEDPDAPLEPADVETPSLLVGDPAVEAATDLRTQMAEQHVDEGEADPGPALLNDGDITTCNVTLSLDFGDGRTNYVGYRATTTVRDGESHDETSERLVEVVQEGVLTAMGSAEQALTAWYETLADRQARLNAITGG